MTDQNPIQENLAEHPTEAVPTHESGNTQKKNEVKSIHHKKRPKPANTPNTAKGQSQTQPQPQPQPRPQIQPQPHPQSQAQPPSQNQLKKPQDAKSLAPVKKPREKTEPKNPIEKKENLPPKEKADRKTGNGLFATKTAGKIVNTGVLEIAMPQNAGNWLKDDIGRYHRAVLSALEKSPISPEGILDLSELWVSTSLPLDLIIEVIQIAGIEPNLANIKEIVFQSQRVWPLSKSEPEV